MAFTAAAMFALSAVYGGMISRDYFNFERNRERRIAAATTIQRHARIMISRKRAEDLHRSLCALIVASLFAYFCFPSSAYDFLGFLLESGLRCLMVMAFFVMWISMFLNTSVTYKLQVVLVMMWLVWLTK